ncbi:hypothetical protein ZWY2020_059557 [Hordeum vulgare]|nr:hypothetical protein ZWY2020_059557 [Hordeum vulgare]
MGVPSFYRWLVEKYPNIVTPAVEEEDCHAGGGAAVYFDNLYLDMNGIIHPCFHPEGQTVTHMPMNFSACPPPATFEDVFRSMFDYMDLLLRIVRPRRLLYLAVDGVAPRAKMNQQRARRFKSAKAAKEAELEENLMRERFRAQGKEVLPRDDATGEVSDPNIITPGTEFMEKLSAALEYYVRARLSSDPRWKDVKVILSDANVPGEGEHKIMSFIRAQRSMENYDPNTRHCLYGLDADLIMLALASHEVHFSILREFLNIWVLREYLELEMTMPGCKHDIERLIDDFIFISFLMGNDFIPHIPSLEIHEYAVDLLIDMYKTTFHKMGGYIVDTDKIKDKHAAYVKISRLEKFLQELASHEEKIFLKRFELREKLLLKIQRQAAGDEWNERNCDVVVAENTLELRRNLNDNLRSKQDLFKNESSKHDRIRLGSPGWKSRFFKEKFGAETSNEIGKHKTEMVQKYLEGLCWCSDTIFLMYYPFYYAPFTSDLKRLSQFKISFTVDKPLLPFDQLMAVSCALPKCYSKLMCCEESTIQMFYPSDLEIDTHGKRFLWQGVAKLPFIDVNLLLSATKTVEKDLAKILLRNSNSLANDAAFVPISEKKLLIWTSEITGWFSQDEDAPSNGFFRSPIRDLPDITHDQTMQAVKPVSRLLDNVIVPDKTVIESDVRTRPMWHTYPAPRPPTVTCRPHTLWKGSSTAMQQREEVKNAGTGWMGRGGGGVGATAADTRQIGRSGFGRGRGDAAGGAETLHRMSGSYVHGRGFKGGRLDGGSDGDAYSFRPGGATAWRPVGTWARGGGRGGNGRPRPW